MAKKRNAKRSGAIPQVFHLENARLFIDAYNLILNDPSLSAQPDMETSREALRTICRCYQARHPGHLLFLVFDGDSSVGCVPEKSQGQFLNEKRDVREVFSETGTTADDWIVRQAKKMLFPGESVVVTRDTELLQTVSTFGVAGLAPETFLREAGHTAGTQANKKGDVAGEHASKSPNKPRSTDRSASEKKVSPNAKKQINDELGDVFADNLDKPLNRF